MFRFTVTIAFVICSWAVAALPSVKSNEIASTGCSNSPRDEFGWSVAILPFQQTIQLQAQAIQSLTQSGRNLTTLKPTECASYELMSSTVTAAIGPLEQKILLQAQTIQGLIESVQNATSTIPTPSVSSTELVSSAIAAAVSAAIAPLEQKILLQAQKIQGLIDTVQNATSISPTPSPICSAELVSSAVSAAVAPLEESIKELKLRLPLQCGPDPGYVYYKDAGNCYKLHEDKMTWPNAHAACTVEQATLAVIRSREQAAVLTVILKTKKATNSAYIGVYQDLDRVWRTLTGETPTAAAGYELWASGVPAGDANNKYAYLQTDGTLTDGYYQRSFICEKVPH